MFDIGWQELFLVALVTILVVGPKELPRVLRTFSAAVRKMRGLTNDFHRGIDELAREADLDDIRRDLENSADLDFNRTLQKTIDSTGEMDNSIREFEGELKSTGVEIEASLSEADEAKPYPTSKNASS